MTRKWDRKMILSGILILLILIRHKCICSYADDYKSSWSNGINHPAAQKHLHQNPRIEAQQEISFPSHHQHKHRHHHADNVYKNNREMHIKLSHLPFNHDRDYHQPATKATTKTPSTTLSKKWDSVTTTNVKLPELTHISFQSGNETSDGTIIPIKNWLNSERNQQSNAYNKQTSTWSYQVQWNTDDTPTSTLKPNHDTRSSWPYYSRHNRDQNLQHQTNQKVSFEKVASASRIHVVDSHKTSHEDRKPKTKVDYDEEYDYYEDIDENRNKVVEDDDIATMVDGLSDYRSEEEVIYHKENFEDKSAVEEKDTMGYSRQSKEDYYDSSEYQKDEPITSSEDHNQTTSLTEEKWNKLGTAAGVARYRQQYLNSAQSKVDAHIQKLKDEGKCRFPHPKVIQLIDASNRFIPHCTILHRCGDDTGCCEDDKKTCVAKKTTLVDLYFYIIPLDNHSKPSIEVRKFENHTECHCINKSRHRRTLKHNIFAVTSTNNSNQNCRCPNDFYVFKEGNQCRCDCLTGNQVCFDLKEGIHRFGSEDQRCIAENKCQKPICEFGHYNKQSGRCPRLRAPASRNIFI